MPTPPFISFGYLQPRPVQPPAQRCKAKEIPCHPQELNMHAHLEHIEEEESCDAPLRTSTTSSEHSLIAKFPMPPTSAPTLTEQGHGSPKNEERRDIHSMEYPESITAAIDSLLESDLLSPTKSGTFDFTGNSHRRTNSFRFSSLGRLKRATRSMTSLRPMLGKMAPPVLPNEQLIHQPSHNDLANYLKHSAPPPSFASSPALLAPKPEKKKEFVFSSLRGKRGGSTKSANSKPDYGVLYGGSKGYISLSLTLPLTDFGQCPITQSSPADVFSNATVAKPVAVRQTTSDGKPYLSIQIPYDEEKALSKNPVTFDIPGNRQMSVTFSGGHPATAVRYRIHDDVHIDIPSPSRVNTDVAQSRWMINHNRRSRDPPRYVAFPYSHNTTPTRRLLNPVNNSRNIGPATSLQVDRTRPPPYQRIAGLDYSIQDALEPTGVITPHNNPALRGPPVPEWTSIYQPRIASDGFYTITSSEEQETVVGRDSGEDAERLRARVADLEIENKKLVGALGELLGLRDRSASEVVEHFEAVKRAGGLIGG